MPTRFDHLRREIGLIDRLPGRSEIMATNVNVTFTGNLQGLIEFLEATFKDPNVMTLQVAASFSPVKAMNPLALLAKEVAQVLGVYENALSTHVNYPNGLGDAVSLAKSGQKIQAIKCLRTLTNCGLKEAKDAVEGPISRAIEAGKV